MLAVAAHGLVAELAEVDELEVVAGRPNPG
jgi:hypothetical protein